MFQAADAATQRLCFHVYLPMTVFHLRIPVLCMRAECDQKAWVASKAAIVAEFPGSEALMD